MITGEAIPVDKAQGDRVIGVACAESSVADASSSATSDCSRSRAAVEPHSPNALNNSDPVFGFC
jgi:hypothetical protein